jgi:hypothetical protein
MAAYFAVGAWQLVYMPISPLLDLSTLIVLLKSTNYKVLQYVHFPTLL